MNVIDIIIIAYLIFAGIIGFKRGVFKELVMCLGTILVFYLAYKLKNPLGEFLLLKLPLLNFTNLFKGVIVLNVLLYQLFSFVLILAILLIVYNVIVSITGIFEKLLKITVVLAVPSKILGFVVGVIEGYVIAFVVLFVLTQPTFNFNLFRESKIGNAILTSSPVLSNVAGDTVELVNDIYELKDEKDTNVLNTKILDMMLDKDIIKYETVVELHKKNKAFNFEGIETVLEEHKGEK